MDVILFKVNRFLQGASNILTGNSNRVCLLSFRGFPDKAVSCCMTPEQSKRSNARPLTPSESEIHQPQPEMTNTEM